MTVFLVKRCYRTRMQRAELKNRSLFIHVLLAKTVVKFVIFSIIPTTTIAPQKKNESVIYSQTNTSSLPLQHNAGKTVFIVEGFQLPRLVPHRFATMNGITCAVWIKYSLVYDRLDVIRIYNQPYSLHALSLFFICSLSLSVFRTYSRHFCTIILYLPLSVLLLPSLQSLFNHLLLYAHKPILFSHSINGCVHMTTMAMTERLI